MFEYLFGAAICTLLFVYFWRHHVVKPHRFPPGPARIPLLGSVYFLPPDVRKGKKKFTIYLQETFGPIAGIYLGNKPSVVVSDFALIKDLYKRYETSGRPISKPFHEIRFGGEDGSQRGILQSTGQEWQEQRRFTIKQLRDMGFGKSSMEDMVVNEVEKFVDFLEKVLKFISRI